MSGKKINLFSWKKLKHRSNGKLQVDESSAINSIAIDNFRNADPSLSGCVPVDSKAVEASELMALARYYEKLCSNKSHQSSNISTTPAGTTTVPCLDASNYLHVLSSHHPNTTTTNIDGVENAKNNSGVDSPLYMPVFRIAQRRSNGLQDVCLSITPLAENYFDLTQAHTSAVLQTIDTLIAKALQLTMTSSAFHHDSTGVSRPPKVVNSNYESILEPVIYSNINKNNNNFGTHSKNSDKNNYDASNCNNNNNGNINVIDNSGEISSTVSSNTSFGNNSPSPPPNYSIAPTSSPGTANFSSTTTGALSSSTNIAAVRRSILLRSKADPCYTKPKGDLKRVQFTLPPLGSDEDHESNEKYDDSRSFALDSSSSSLPLGIDSASNDCRHKAPEYAYGDHDNMQEEKESLKRSRMISSGGGCAASPFQSTSNKGCTFLNPEDIDDFPSTEMSDECYSDEEEDSTIGHSSTISIFSVDTQPVGLFCSSISTSTHEVATTACNSLGFQPSKCIFLQPSGEELNTSKIAVEKSSSHFDKNMLEVRYTSRRKKKQSKSHVEDRNDHDSQNAVEEITPKAEENRKNKNGRTMTVYYSADDNKKIEEIGYKTTEYSLSREEEYDKEEKEYGSKDDGTTDGYTTDDTATATTTSGYYSYDISTETNVASRTSSVQSGSNATATSTESTEDDYDVDVDNDDETTKNTTDESRDDSEFTWQASFPSKEFMEEDNDGTTTSRATEMEYLDSSNDVAVLDKMARLEVVSPTTKNTPIHLSISGRRWAEEGTTGTVAKHISNTRSTEKVKTNLKIMIDDHDQPPTTPYAISMKAAPTRATAGWSILSPKKLLSIGTSPSSWSKTKYYSTTISDRHSVEWNIPGLDNNGISPRKLSNRAVSTSLASNCKVRSPSPSPRYLIKTVVHSSIGGMKSSHE